MTDTICWSYQDRGHTFVCFYLPAAETTWVYDVATQAWHERALWDPTALVVDAAPGALPCVGLEKHLVGDRQSPAVYHLDAHTYTDGRVVAELMPLTNIALTLTNDGPAGDFGRNVLVYDLATGTLVTAVNLVDTIEGLERHPVSLLYRPEYDDVLVLTGGITDGGLLFRLNRSFVIVDSVALAVTGFPGTDVWEPRLVRSDFHGGLYVAYAPSTVGTAAGDQFIRKIDPVTFQPVVPAEDWQTVVTPLDARSPVYADFALDGQTFFVAMVGGADPNQHVIYQLDLTTSLSTAFATYGTWSGGINPTGNTYQAGFLRPRSDGTYVVATKALSGTDQNILNSVLLLAADGTVTTVWPLAPTLIPPVHMYGVSGLAVQGDTLWYVTGNGRLARLNLTTGAEATMVDIDPGAFLSFADLVVLTGGGGEPPYVPVDYDIDARYLRRLRRAPHLAQEHHRVFIRTFELDLERGQGLATGQGSDPLVMLRISRDGGQTWGEEILMAAGSWASTPSA